MSQTGTPTEFLGLGITEPDDTLNVLVDLNGQWRKIDTGVKNVDTKATTNAGNITTLQGAVQDNTENITNILDTNVNQQNSIDTLQTKVAALEEDDTSYGSRITAVENGVQENSELINDLEVEVSGVKLDMGTVPSGSNLQGEVDGLDTRVTALENSGSVAAVEARVTTLEGSVDDIEDTIGTVPSGETVQGQINGLNTDVSAIEGQVNSGNIPFRFSVDGGGNYGYLKADDSFVPFSSGDSHWHELDTSLYIGNFVNDYKSSFIVPYNGWYTSDSPNYGKLHDLIHDIDYTLPHVSTLSNVGSVIMVSGNSTYIANNGTLTPINGDVYGVFYDSRNKKTSYLTKNANTIQWNVLDEYGNIEGLPVTYTIHGTPNSMIYFSYNEIHYMYNGVLYHAVFDSITGTVNETTPSAGNIFVLPNSYVSTPNYINGIRYGMAVSNNYHQFTDVVNKICFTLNQFLFYNDSKWWYYI